MRKISLMRVAWAVFVLLLAFSGSEAAARGASPRWGADYFPNVPLVTQDGQEVRFFDDLLKDKVVVINFIYTSCPDTCPLETARLSSVKEILGDRVGRDVFLYSITIDPETDTPAVLKEYTERFQTGDGWLFLTGQETDITLLRRKLGLYIDDIQDGSNDHNLSMIIGNQSTSRWMKASPFENPYVLAEKFGGKLHTWRTPQQAEHDYATAPKLRSITNGESLFRTRCAACHTIGGGDINEPSLRKVGPDLLGVVSIRDRDWLVSWLSNPEKMLAEEDPIIMALYEKYNQVPMPDLRLNRLEVEDLIEHMEAETSRIEKIRPEAVAAVLREAQGPKACCLKKKTEIIGSEVANAEQPQDELVAVADTTPDQRVPVKRASILFSGVLGASLLLLAVISKKR
jgi:protein SCO1/2